MISLHSCLPWSRREGEQKIIASSSSFKVVSSTNCSPKDSLNCSNALAQICGSICSIPLTSQPLGIREFSDYPATKMPSRTRTWVQTSVPNNRKCWSIAEASKQRGIRASSLKIAARATILIKEVILSDHHYEGSHHSRDCGSPTANNCVSALKFKGERRDSFKRFESLGTSSVSVLCCFSFLHHTGII